MSSVAWLLESRVAFPLRVWNFVCCVCCAGSGLWKGLITRSEGSYRMCLSNCAWYRIPKERAELLGFIKNKKLRWYSQYKIFVHGKLYYKCNFIWNVSCVVCDKNNPKGNCFTPRRSPQLQILLLPQALLHIGSKLLFWTNNRYKNLNKNIWKLFVANIEIHRFSVSAYVSQMFFCICVTLIRIRMIERRG